MLHVRKQLYFSHFEIFLLILFETNLEVCCAHADAAYSMSIIYDFELHRSTRPQSLSDYPYGRMFCISSFKEVICRKLSLRTQTIKDLGEARGQFCFLGEKF